MHKTNIFYGLNEKKGSGRSGAAPLRCFQNQIPLSKGLPSKHLWKVRNWSNKLQHETLCSPGWVGCLIAGIHLPHLLSSFSQQGQRRFLTLSVFHPSPDIESSLLSVLPALFWPDFQSDFLSHTSDWLCKNQNWVFLFSRWVWCWNPLVYSSILSYISIYPHTYTLIPTHAYICTHISQAPSGCQTLS